MSAIWMISGPRPSSRPADLHEHELARDGLALFEIDHLDHVDQLPELLNAQVERGLVALEDGGDPRQRRVMRGRDVKRVDVEAAAGKHAGDAGQNAELVLNEDGDGMSHVNGFG